MIRAKSRVVGEEHKVSIAIDVEEVGIYGYGYGYEGDELDYFNVFGLNGSYTGYFTEILDQGDLPDGYKYGFGYEYTSNIASENRERQITVTVTPEDESYDVEYDLKIKISGQGYSDVKTGTTTNKQFTFSVFDSKVHSDQKYTFYHEVLNEATQVATVSVNQTIGEVFLADRDSFFDVSVEVLDTVTNAPTIKAVSKVIQQSDISIKKFKVKSLNSALTSPVLSVEDGDDPGTTKITIQNKTFGNLNGRILILNGDVTSPYSILDTPENDTIIVSGIVPTVDDNGDKIEYVAVISTE